LAGRPEVEIVAVVTQPDRPAGRGQRLAPSPVKTAALAHDLPVLAPTALRAFAFELAALQPGLAVVASYGRIVPQPLLDAVPLWLNVHPSLLPRYRGATPIQSALRDGCSETGVTIIAMDAGMDTGDVVAQTAPIPIGAQETYGELHDRLADAGASLLGRALDAHADGTLARTKQDDARATVTRPLAKSDRLLVPYAREHGARAVVDLVRSLAPKPGALLVDERLGALVIQRAHAETARPQHAVALAAADGGWVVADVVVPPGRRAMAGADFLRGALR
jgi:methionyl-tRNA formyltransferase